MRWFTFNNRRSRQVRGKSSDAEMQSRHIGHSILMHTEEAYCIATNKK